MDGKRTLTLFNDNDHTQGEVIVSLVKALGCSSARAAQIMEEANDKGSSAILRAPLADCERVRDTLDRVLLRSEISAH